MAEERIVRPTAGVLVRTSAMAESVKVSGNRIAFMLNFYAPGGFEQFFRERAAATAAPAELTSRYDWERT